MIACQVENFQVRSQADPDREDIDLTARVPEGATPEQFRIMLQNMLAERFHLKPRREPKEFAALDLQVGKDGAKLKPASLTAPPDWLRDGFRTWRVCRA